MQRRKEGQRLLEREASLPSFASLRLCVEFQFSHLELLRALSNAGMESENALL
jgi:hypothetical protein